MKNKLILLTCFVFTSLFYSCKEELEDPRLTVDFSADASSVKAGNPVTFTDLSTGNASKWNWTFEGGTPATSPLSSPQVVYDQPGTYAVTLTLSNAKNTATLTRETFITVSFNEVAANFEAGKTTIKQGESLAFKDLSSGQPTAWLWEFIPATGSPLTATVQNPTVTFQEPGLYTVKLTASNPEYSNQVTKTGFLTVLDITSVSAAFSAAEGGTYAGGTVTFQDQSVGTATAWNWTFEGGSPATAATRHPAVTYAAPGRYRVKLVASNSAKSSTVEKEGYIVVVPATDLAAFYPFNGNTNDAGPHKIAPNQVLGAITFAGTDHKGGTNNTAVFDGASALTVADNNALNFETGDFSIACWVKTDKTNKMMIWQESGMKGSKDNQSWLRIGDNVTTQYLRFAVEDGSGGTIVSIGSEGRVSDDSWHHVVCVREGTSSRVYIDGALVKSGTAPAPKDVSNEQSFKIGGQEGTTSFSNFFNGQLDDLLVYKKALTPAEITALFNL